MLGGLMLLQRLQDVVFMLIIVVEICSLLIQVRGKRWKQILRLVMPVLVFVAGVVLTFLPQIITWQILYGKLFPTNMERV